MGRRAPRSTLTPSEYQDLVAAEMTEATLQRQVTALARSLGWRVLHVTWSIGTAPGWPDCTMIHTVQRRVMWRELKTARGRVSDAQRSWLDDMVTAGLDAGIWRPMDLLDGTVKHQLTHHEG